MRALSNILCFVLTAALSLACVNSAQAIKVLFHGREAGATFRDDPFILIYLETTYGAANVTYMQGSAAAADGSSANGFDVVFLSSTMASSSTRDKYEDSPVGVVCDENALVSDGPTGNFMLSDNGGNQDATVGTTGKNKINILNSAHPLAGGLSGEVTVFNTTVTDTYWWQFARGDLAPGVVRVAETLLDIGGPTGISADYNGDFEVNAADHVLQRDGVNPLANEVATLGTNTSEDDVEWRRRFGSDSLPNSGDLQHAILAAEVGAELWGSAETGRPLTAAGRRVFFFMSDFGFADLSTDGVTLFKAAIDWAAVDPGAASGSSLGGVPEPGCCTLAIIALLGGWGMCRRRPATAG